MTLSPEERAAVKEWWLDLVYSEDGTLDENAVLDELHDFHFMIMEVPKVYSAITCGAMSKPSYYAHQVILQAEECQTEAVKYEMLRALDDLEAGAVTIAELRKEYSD